MKNVNNTLDRPDSLTVKDLTRETIINRQNYDYGGSENVPPEISLIPNSISVSPRLSCDKIAKVRKRKSSGDENKSSEFTSYCSTYDDPSTSTPYKVKYPEFSDSLESYSFESASSINNMTFQEHLSCVDTKSFTADLTNPALSKTYVLSNKTPLKSNVSKSLNNIHQMGVSNCEENAEALHVDKKFTQRPINDRCTYTVSSSKMTQSLNDIAKYFKTKPQQELTTQSSKCHESTYITPLSNEYKTLRSNIDRTTFVIPFPKRISKDKDNLISASMDNIDCAKSSFNMRPRSLSTSITYLGKQFVLNNI